MDPGFLPTSLTLLLLLRVRKVQAQQEPFRPVAVAKSLTGATLLLLTEVQVISSEKQSQSQTVREQLPQLFRPFSKARNPDTYGKSTQGPYKPFFLWKAKASEDT